MATKKQRAKKTLKEIYVDGVLSTGDRKTDADTYGNKIKASNAYLSAQWIKMRGDVCK